MRPLFIGGCGRSGTTMLGDLLGVPAAHVCTPETTFKWGLVREHAWPEHPDDTLAWLARYPKFRELGIELGAPARAARTLRELLEAIVTSYANAVGKPSASVWIDHTPNNIVMGRALLAAFPDAKFVDLVRDGRAIAASVIPLDWGPNDVIEAAEQWMRFLAHGHALAAAYPGRVLRVRYEDLVREPERQLATICAFAELAYDPAMAAGGGFRLPASLARQHALVGKRPDPSRLDAWKQSLSPREIEVFEFMVGELLPLNGYAPIHGDGPRPPSALAELYYDARSYLQNQLNRMRKRRRIRDAGFQPR